MIDPAATDGEQSKLPQNEAKRRLEKYKQSGLFLGPCGADQINEDLDSHALALKDDGSPVEIMHTDACGCILSSSNRRRLTRLVVTFRLPPSTTPPPDPLFQFRLPSPTSPDARRSHYLHPPHIPCRPLHTSRRPHRQPSLQHRSLARSHIHNRRLPRHRRLGLEFARPACQRSRSPAFCSSHRRASWRGLCDCGTCHS